MPKRKHIGDVTIAPKNTIGNTGATTNPTPKSK
jgi:hypothetical protein